MQIKKKAEELISVIQSFNNEQDIAVNDYEKLVQLFDNPAFRLFVKKTHQAIAVFSFLENRYLYISESISLYCPAFNSSLEEFGPDLFIGMMTPSSANAMVASVTPGMMQACRDYKSKITSLHFTACVEINPSPSNIQWALMHSYLLNATPEGFPTLSCSIVSDVSMIKKDPFIHYSAHLVTPEKSDLLYAKMVGSDSELVPLSKRELEVLHLVGKGKTTRDIADSLFISFETAKKHRSNILEKMSCANTVELLNRATVMGLV